MKAAKLTIWTTALALGAIVSANAQMMRAGVHLSPSWAMGNLSDNGAGFGIGGNLFTNYFFNENFHLGLEAGYQSFNWEGVVFGGDHTGTYNIIPFQFTTAYHSDAEAILNLYAGTGIGIFVVQRTFSDPFLQNFIGEDTHSMIGFSPRVGLSYRISSKLRFDGNIAFTYMMGNETIYQGGAFSGHPDLMMLNVNLGLAFLIFE